MLAHALATGHAALPGVHYGPGALFQAPAPVHLRSVLPPGFIRHAAEFPGEYRNGRTVQPQRGEMGRGEAQENALLDRKSTRLNSSHVKISYAVFCLKKKKNK